MLADVDSNAFVELGEMSSGYRRAWSYYQFTTADIVQSKLVLNILESEESANLSRINSLLGDFDGHISSNFYNQTDGSGSYYVTFSESKSRQWLLGFAELLHQRLEGETILVEPVGIFFNL